MTRKDPRIQRTRKRLAPLQMLAMHTLWEHSYSRSSRRGDTTHGISGRLCHDVATASSNNRAPQRVIRRGSRRAQPPMPFLPHAAGGREQPSPGSSRSASSGGRGSCREITGGRSQSPGRPSPPSAAPAPPSVVGSEQIGGREATGRQASTQPVPRIFGNAYAIAGRIVGAGSPTSSAADLRERKPSTTHPRRTTTGRRDRYLAVPGARRHGTQHTTRGTHVRRPCLPVVLTPARGHRHQKPHPQRMLGPIRPQLPRRPRRPGFRRQTAPRWTYPATTRGL